VQGKVNTVLLAGTGGALDPLVHGALDLEDLGARVIEADDRRSIARFEIIYFPGKL
jgi:hypothetical protein